MNLVAFYWYCYICMAQSAQLTDVYSITPKTLKIETKISFLSDCTFIGTSNSNHVYIVILFLVGNGPEISFHKSSIGHIVGTFYLPK